MIDINFIRNNPGILDTALKNRNKNPLENELLSADKLYREALSEQQNSLEQRNIITAEFGKLKAKGSNVSELSLKEEIGNITRSVGLLNMNNPIKRDSPRISCKTQS